MTLLPLEALTVPLSIPSPSQGVWHLGPFPVRGYALSIILGIVVAVVIAERRWKARGGRVGEIQDIALWAVPFGVVGGRLYHVATDSDLYFGAGRRPIEALYIWNGGLGVWGAVALGALGAVIGARRAGIRLLPVLDAIAPAVLVAQAIGRWGNWFNQELFGRPTDLPWALSVSDRTAIDAGYPPGTTFHPTFLYESLWNLAAFGVIVVLDRRLRLGHGRVVALYVMLYTLGRGWIESLRIDAVELSDVGGLRFNVWVSIVLFVLATAYFVISGRRGAPRETEVYVEGRGPRRDESAEASGVR
ncbi:prolipoprotein diacylglyceryl transferase [Nocardioides sp. TRM66260-LWL]|uniref:prolipoprotein diacylglyceryl transferase n=1 Tax=Nocardioides sp. TRM66260-LWL TaxID=2874478 RepID=UPI001CC5B196|nr:prolipoprotein diacylglyceryl transferase [Nocardioides sp. TRM66260-LWL]MBZ5733384.1 prolipoprotein diacylglyceryl transferase [Nocardioides sp. TRM66260-LWL]